MNPQDQFWKLFNAGELIELDAGTGTGLNIAATFGSNAGSILAVFQAASGVTLSESQMQEAESAGLEVAAAGEPSVRSRPLCSLPKWMAMSWWHAHSAV